MRTMVQNSFRHLALLTGSVLLTLVAVELLLRWHPPVMIYMRTRNIVQQTHSEPSTNDILFYIPKANLSKPFSNREFHTLVTINSRHMRDREYPYEKPKGIRRIAMAGDSFVFGWGVENDEVFTEILENQLLKNVEVLNFGVSGYNARQEFERLRTEAVLFKPDIAFLFLYGFPEDNTAPFEFRRGNLYWALKEKRTPWLNFKLFIERNLSLFWLYQEAKGWIYEHFMAPPTQQAPDEGPSPEEISKGLKVLSDFKALSQEYGFVPIAVFIPNKWELMDSAVLKQEGPLLRKLSDFCKGEGIRLWDLTPSLQESWKKSGKSPYFRFDDHWNKRGHQTAAAFLAERLKKEGLL